MRGRKVHSGAKKRFKVSARGRVRARAAGKRHLNTGKSGARMRRKKKWNTLDGGMEQHIRRLLEV